jgi:hypothetical protein
MDDLRAASLSNTVETERTAGLLDIVSHLKTKRIAVACAQNGSQSDCVSLSTIKSCSTGKYYILTYSGVAYAGSPFRPFRT